MWVVDVLCLGVIVAYNTGLLTSRTFAMNRKLRHTLSALTASGAALAIALMVAVPANPTPVQAVVQALPLPAAAGQRAGGIDTLAQAVALSADALSMSASAAS